MIGGPILEQWLLSGKAVHKNITVGGAGLVQIPVPEGKSYIITNIELLPFANIITNGDRFADPDTFAEVVQQTLRDINKRIQFQLVFYNNRTSSVYNVRNKFFINTYDNGELSTHTAPAISFEKHSFDTFHVVETNSWLFLKYIDFETIPPTIYQTAYPDIFDGSQNWPPSPNFGYANQFDISEFDVNATSFNYPPQGVSGAYPPDVFNNNQIFPSWDLAEDPSQNSTFIPPFVLMTNTGGPLSPDINMSLPYYNISVIEINKRLTTNLLL
jgi:hypothetical protein